MSETLTALQAAYDAASEAVRVATAEHSKAAAAVMACHEASTTPPVAVLNRWHLAGHRVTIAQYHSGLAECRLARYRIAAHGWHRASAKDRAARHPGREPRSMANFAAFHGLAET